MTIRRQILAFCFLMLVPAALFAQSTNATIAGQVTDPSKAVIPQAKIAAINVNTGVQYGGLTNGSGQYVIPSIQPGDYRIEVEKAGFKTIIKPDVVLHVQDTVQLNFEMAIGSTSETVTVKGGAPLIDTQDATVSTVIDRQFVANLPLNGRSFQSLIRLAPGVVTTASSFGEEGQFSVNGQRPDTNYFSVDGVSANVGVSSGNGLAGSGAVPGTSALGGTNNLVSVDALQEFRIQTSTFAPEFGRTPGAQVEILTRSGTNEFHGNVFDYFRNDALDANDWFANHFGLRKPPNRQNDFGGVLGGPILKNKTFFFFSYEGLRLAQPTTSTVTVPSLSARAAAAPRIRPILDAFVIPNGKDFGNGLADFSASYSNPSNLNATSIRIDQALGSKLTVFGRYNHAPSSTTIRGEFGDSLNEVDPTYNSTDTLTLGATWAISPSTSNEFRFNYSRTEGRSLTMLTNFGGAVVPPDSTFFPPPFTSKDALVGVTLFNFQANFFQGKNVDNSQTQFNYVDNYSIVRGGHTLKFGVDYRRLVPGFGPRAYDQEVVFNDLNSVSTGTADEVVIDANQSVDLYFHNFSAYGQDTWRVNPRLTLTYGARWDVNPAPSGKPEPFAVTNFNNLSNLALAPRGTSLYNTTYGNFAPRFGGVYQLSQQPGHETVLRGGIGIFYDLGTGSAGNIAGTGSFPFGATNTLFSVPYPLTPAEAAPPPIVDTPPVSRIEVFDPQLKLPRTYEWNVAIERSLGPSRALSATYVGAAGRSLLQQGFVLGLNATFPGFTTFITNGGSSDYHALQLQFQQRLWAGFQATASYTWSHSIDTASSDNAAGTTIIANLNPNVNRGNSDFDIRHSVNAALTYNIPAPNHGFLDKAFLHGWAFDSIIGARTPLPVDLIGLQFVASSSQLFFSNIRPDLVPGVPVYLYGNQYPGGKALNPAAFVAPPEPPAVPTIRQGTLGRNALRGFSFAQVDFALRREFSVTGRLKLQFRAEAFNIFNKPNFGNPVNNIASPNFGQSIQSLANYLGGVGSGFGAGGFNPLYQIGGPRSGQLALKLLF